MRTPHQKNNKKFLVRTPILCALFCLLGFGLGYVVKPSTAASSPQSLREHSEDYRFIHPLLAVSRSDALKPSPAYAPLSREVERYIAAAKAKGTLSNASAYFINYGTNGSFAINADEPYDPASMLKVVIMVAYLRQGESDSSALSRELVYTQAVDDATTSVPLAAPTSLKVGWGYGVGQLIRSMIADSDNGAMNLLLANVDEAYLSRVYTDLGLDAPATDAPYTISARDYSLFFRVLYNSTYLSRADSEKALSLLSEATFKDGLVAGLPEGAVVAHKFGQHVNGAEGAPGSIELHDCGIVYSSGGPYLLCVMTKGPTLDGLKGVIAGISKLVYARAGTQ